MTDILLFDSVTKRFGDTTVFDGDDARLAPGLTFLVGRNGAGKSTFARLATGLERPTSGSVRLFGEPTHSLSVSTRRRFGVQLQNDAFLRSVRVREYIGLHERLYAAEGHGSVERFIDMLDIGPLLSSYAYALSGGQKKRVSLLLAVIGHRELLVLDEPTAGIDVEVKDKIMRVIRALRTEGTAILASSHDLGEFFEIADNVLVVDRGIRFDGSRSEFLARFGYDFKVVLPGVGADTGLPRVRDPDGTSYFSRSRDELAAAFPEAAVLSTTPKDLYQLATRESGRAAE